MLPGLASIIGGLSGGPIQFVGGAVANKAGATSGTSTIALNSGLTGGIASSVSAGDFVIAVFAVGSTANDVLSITDGTSDYTLIDSQVYSGDAFDTILRVAYKVMGSSPDTATTFGATGGVDDAGAMAVYVFRNVNQTSPLDVAAVPAEGTDSILANPAAITPVTAGAYIVVIGAGAHNDGGAVTYASSELTDFLTTAGNDVNDIVLGIGHKPDWTSGAFNPAAFTYSTSDSVNFSWAAMTIALRPAG